MKPEAVNQRACRSSPSKAPVSICCMWSPRAETDRDGLTDRPVDEQVRTGAGDPLGQVALDDVDEQHPAAGAVVHAPPGSGQADLVAYDDVLAGPQPRLGDLDEHAPHPGGGPAATVALVVAQQLGQPSEVEAVGGIGSADRPAVGQRRRDLTDDLLGIGLEAGLVGAHDR